MKLSKSSILLIDDDMLVATSLARLLRRNNFEVSLCPDPKSALNFCKKIKFDLIITDQRMPVMDGTEFAEKVNKLQPQVRIILISGYSDKEKVRIAHDKHYIHKFVSKPWENNELVSIIKKEITALK